MIYCIHEYNKYTKVNSYAVYGDNIPYTEFAVLSNFLTFLKENTEETFIICENGDFAQLFKDYKVINLIQDTADNFDLDYFMGHSFLLVSLASLSDKMSALVDLYQQRLDYIKAKEELGDVSLPNSQLVAKYLDLKKDDKAVDLPIKVDPNDCICQYFLNGNFNNTFTTKLCSAEICFSGGGVHSSLICCAMNYSSDVHTTSDTTPTKAYYKDITSFYPSILNYYGLFKNDKFKEVYNKHISNKTPATKLILNTISGLLELYQPPVARTMRITGQLLIYYVLKEINDTCPSFKILNLNTDGFMYEVDESEVSKVEQILTNSELAKVSTIKSKEIKKIFIKDVNNLVCEFNDGEIKVAGNLNYGVNTKGKFSINNNGNVIKKAVLENMLHGTDITEYINTDTDYLHDYQYIVELSDKFDSILFQGNELKQKVIRAYATTDLTGTLYKKKKEEYQSWKIPNIPDNVSLYVPNNIDKGYYIAQAITISKQYGIKTTKRKEANMPEKEHLNVYQKLALARKKFAQSNVKKTGWNDFQKFPYFTLDDIVPVISPIFDEIGLIQITDIYENYAIMEIVNLDDVSDKIVFHSPIKETDEKAPFNTQTQQEGALETYHRRYLYLRALDITEPETIDAQDNTIRTPQQVVEQPIQKANYIPNQEKRQNAKEIVLNKDTDQADETAIANLQKAIDEAIKVKPSLVGMINQLYIETNHLKNISTERVGRVIAYLSEAVSK